MPSNLSRGVTALFSGASQGIDVGFRFAQQRLQRKRQNLEDILRAQDKADRLLKDLEDPDISPERRRLLKVRINALVGAGYVPPELFSEQIPVTGPVVPGLPRPDFGRNAAVSAGRNTAEQKAQVSQKAAATAQAKQGVVKQREARALLRTEFGRLRKKFIDSRDVQMDDYGLPKPNAVTWTESDTQQFKALYNSLQKEYGSLSEGAFPPGMLALLNSAQRSNPQQPNGRLALGQGAGTAPDLSFPTETVTQESLRPTLPAGGRDFENESTGERIRWDGTKWVRVN